jgi:hypothetical protein
MTKHILLHIGYHKTATTWLQRCLFTPEHGYHQIADHAEVFRHIVGVHGLSFEASPVRALIADRLKDLPQSVTPVVSSEILSGHPFDGGRESDIYAERLARIVPGARILISIRSQLKILPSVYMQYLSRGGTMSWGQFFSGTDEVGYFGFRAQHFEYDRLVAKYQKLFGAVNVLVLTQESIRADMGAAAASIARFADNRGFEELSPAAYRIHGASYPEYAAPILRRVNQVQASTLNPCPIVSLGRTPRGLYRWAGYALKSRSAEYLLGEFRPVSDFVHARFSGLFRDSNVRLADSVKHPLDLSEYD